MKILHVGSSGIVGRAVKKELSKRHEIIEANRTSGDVKVDMTDPESIKEMYSQVSNFDALVVTAGGGHFGPLKEMTTEEARKGLDSKMLGQINLILLGQDKINPGGSFTLTSGILADDPIKNASIVSLVNGGLNSFVKAAAMEMENGTRINIVSPGLVEDSFDELRDVFPGHVPAKMWEVAMGYVKSVEGGINGEVVRVF